MTAQTEPSPVASIPASPKLRADVRFHARPGDDAHMIVEDPQRGRFYRVGAAEYALLCEFDGHTPLNIALERARQIQPSLQLSIAQAAGLAHWLERAQLAYRTSPQSAAEIAHWAKSEISSQEKASINPFFIRIPLLHPDRLLTALVPWFGWFFSLPATLMTLAAAGWALLPLAARWRDVTGDLEDLLTPHRQLALFVVWLVMKVLHEFGHGIVCKCYGGHVREAGATFILFAPAAYTDVTSAWRLASMWQRIHISAAGMYVEIATSALAAIVWGATSSEQVRQMAADVILLGTISTVLFNLNPLMRFDGYYILGDLLGLQNLYELGRSYVHYWGKRYLLGIRVAAPRLPARRAAFVRVYGFASAFWYFVARFGTLAGLAIIFHGAGLFLAFIGLVWWYVVPTARFVRWLFRGPLTERPATSRALFVAVGGSAMAVSILAFVPASLPATAPAIVEYAPPTVLRARTPGFVDRIFVDEGEVVRKDQLLCVLRNDALQVELAGLESQLARTEIRAMALRQRLSRTPQEHVAYGVAMSELGTLSTRVFETRSKLADLEVRAPHSGRLVRRRLDRLQGVYLNVGDEIVSLGSEDEKQLHLSLAQEDVESLSQLEGAAIKVYMPGVGGWSATLDRLDPRATVQPPNAALCAPNGGPLAVARVGNAYEFAAPRFSAFVNLSAERAVQLRAGQCGTVAVGCNSETLGSSLVRVFVRVWERALYAEH